MILVTGGAGFIGANFVHAWFAQQTPGKPVEAVLNLDKLSYAGNLDSLRALRGEAAHRFVQGDIGDRALLDRLFAEHQPRAVLHFAAESHVDRSIDGPAAFIATNVLGTGVLLEATRAYWQTLPAQAQADFRFLHVSTDEVYGSLEADDPPFCEHTLYAPNSPYSASKAGADHLVRAWHHTYRLPTLTTHCSNNYGPYQFPEKLIPHMLTQALAGAPLPVYGNGQHVRDWLHVHDHCAALREVLAKGVPGAVYNIGGGNEIRNLDVVQQLCDWLDHLHPRGDAASYRAQIRFVTDRPGHDKRYAIDARRLSETLGWRPRESFASGLEQTVRWYLAHTDWVARIQSGEYRHWVQLEQLP